MASEHLLTVSEFNNLVSKWAMKVRARARATLSSGTHGTGNLATTLAQYVDKKSPQEPAYKVKFCFNRYGVFRAYGAGRGWVVINGSLSRGFRAASSRIASSELSKNGYTKSEISRAKFKIADNNGAHQRQPLDWIDQHINATIDELANDVQEFYGDEALRKLLNEFNKMRIVKK